MGQGFLDICQRQVRIGEPARIHRDMDLLGETAPRIHLGNAGDGS